ncbi:MAG: HAD family phosphatase [Algisphaera sp.]
MSKTFLSRVLPRHRAIVFDCDGTLADSMPVHWQAWKAAFDQAGWDGFPDYPEYITWGGMSGKAVALRAAACSGHPQPDPAVLAQIIGDKQTHYLKLACTITPIESVLAVARAHRGKLPMAIATGSRRRNVTQTLKAINALDWFDVVVSADDVEHHKPHPETFLKAAEALGVAPEDCLAFEDAPPGIESARAADMDVVDVTCSPDREREGAE